MRDLRLIATTDIWPEEFDMQDDRWHHMHNLQIVMKEAPGPLHITETVWEQCGFQAVHLRKKASAQANIQEFARKNAYKVYLVDEATMTERTKMSLRVWDNGTLDLVDKIYDREFRRSGAIAHFGDWQGTEWHNAMKCYRSEIRQRLPREWKIRLKDVGKSEADQLDAVALEEAPMKVEWLQKLQIMGYRPLDVPFLCDKFMQDLVSALTGAEAGFKLVSPIY